VRALGSADEVCDLYQNDLSGASSENAMLSKHEKKIEPSQGDGDTSNLFHDIGPDPDLRKNSIGDEGGTLELEFWRFQITDENDQPITVCRSGALIKLRTLVAAKKDVPAGAVVGLLFADKTGYPLIACNTNFYDKTLPKMKKGERAVVEWILKCPFSLGEFRVDIGLKSEPFSDNFYDRVFCAAVLCVSAAPQLLKKNYGGYVFVDADIRISIGK
jgi:lipopolysaccharide transport system ATP-binding protein